MTFLMVSSTTYQTQDISKKNYIFSGMEVTTISPRHFGETNNLISTKQISPTTARMGFSFSGIWGFLVAKFTNRVTKNVEKEVEATQQMMVPGDLPWNGSQCGNETIILQSGIAAVTCGVTTSVPDAEQWSFGLIDIDGAIPNAGRSEATGQAMYHHPSWHIDSIGNVYGIALNNTNGCMFITASSNYGAGFLNKPSITQYGSIGGGTDDLDAAGTVYKIDAVTGQASVFAQLPQLSTTITHQDCEGAESVTRTTGVGLGNITYDEVHDQYFVSNIEDGRIYRLNSTGVILDSFDPLTYDDGVAGISILEELPYGLAVEPGGSRLFFGVIDAPNGGSDPGASTVPIYSIPLDVNGGFVGTIDNTVLPAGIPNNYVGTETLHFNLPVGSNSGCTYANNTTYQISDLSFDPSGNLLAGVRVGCENNFHTSYNHWGETSLLTPDGGGLYSSATELDISATGQCGNDDGYGGVSYWELQDGSGDVQYVTTSADILFEQGPHGISVFDSQDATAGQISPLGAISYGTVDNNDPKGVGGDVEVFSAANCCAVASSVASNINSSCGESSDGALSINGLNSASGTYEYSIDGGTTWVSNVGAASYNFSGLALGDYTVLVRDLADPTACISAVEATIVCDGNIEIQRDTLSGFANVSSSGGSDPNTLSGPIEAVGATASATNSSTLSDSNSAAILRFDEVLPIGTTVIISIAIGHPGNFFFPTSATISDFTNDFTFSGGTSDEIQHIPFTLGQATNTIAIDVNTSIFNINSTVLVDGASFNDVATEEEIFVCNVCPSCQVPTPEIATTDNDCVADTPGVFSVTTACGAGSTMEWSTDNGTTWSITVPTYDAVNAMTVIARCVDDADNTCVSENATVTSAPNDCCPTPNCFGITIQQN